MLSQYQSAKVVILSERRFQFHSLEKGVGKKVLNTSVGLKGESASGGRGVRFFFEIRVGVNTVLKLGIPIDRVPTSKSCVFCLGIKFLFFPI